MTQDHRAVHERDGQHGAQGQACSPFVDQPPEHNRYGNLHPYREHRLGEHRENDRYDEPENSDHGQEFKEDYDKIKDGFLTLFNESLNKLTEAKHLIPPENFIEIKYEDFVQNPVPFMKDIYEKFELEGFEDVKPEFLAHYRSQKEGYAANNWDLNDEVIREVNANWNVYREQYGYERLEPSS